LRLAREHLRRVLEKGEENGSACSFSRSLDWIEEERKGILVGRSLSSCTGAVEWRERKALCSSEMIDGYGLRREDERSACVVAHAWIFS
jgi:hypothetical protein